MFLTSCPITSYKYIDLCFWQAYCKWNQKYIKETLIEFGSIRKH